ncbi:hypothetical protein L3Q82_008316 [Scortum barcoo]|uniref:Uncharacterized protein n=1 Tax=Scortum barcoo TaxID=214431 RepID=A0ACB8WHV2_9TELE|nr:hypothetical protein L3Q82_008316 [Scortum barcoo]
MKHSEEEDRAYEASTRVCRSVPSSTNPRPRPSRTSSPTTIHSVGYCAKPFKWCTVELDGVCLPLLLDTAASRSLFSESTVRQLFPRQSITAGAEELYGYSHAKIGMVGTCAFSVRYGSRFLLAFTFQVFRHGANLLGFDLFCALGFSIMDNTGTAILTVRQHSAAGLGSLNTFNHQPLIDPTLSPVHLYAAFPCPYVTMSRPSCRSCWTLASLRGLMLHPGSPTWWWQERSRAACTPVSTFDSQTKQLFLTNAYNEGAVR